MQVRTALQTYAVLGVLLCVVGVLSLLTVPEVPRWLSPLGLIPGLVYYLAASRRERLRRRVLREPFPLEWREILLRRIPFYRSLSVAESGRFEQEIQVFLAEHNIYPVPGVELWQRSPHRFGEEARVLIAASAATLLLGRPEWRLPTIRDIVVYPTSFTEESYEITDFGHTLGMVHAQGPILFSLPALLRAYPPLGPEGERGQGLGTESDPAQNVGVHEFAHVIDFIDSGGRPSGVPAILSGRARERWQRQLFIERERLEGGRSALHPYGLKNDAELFAVSVEAFFGDPLRLRTLHPGLYDLLAELFNQDPAARVLPQRTHWLLRPWFAAPVRYVA